MIEDLLRARHRRDHEDFDPGLELIALARGGDAEARSKAALHLASHPEDAEALLFLDAFEAKQRPRVWSSAPKMLALAASIAVIAYGASMSFRSSDGLWSKGLVPGSSRSELHLAVDREGRRFALARGAELYGGDRVGFFYTATEASYLAVIHRDAFGHASVMYPANGEVSAAIRVGK